MNRLPKLIVWFLTLLFVQTFVFDSMLLGTPFVPFIYVLLLILLPNDLASWAVLLTGFFIGLSIDFIYVSGGVHTTACIIISYARPLFIRAVYSDTISLQNLKIEQESFGELFRYTAFVILVHHFLVFVFVVGSTERIGWLLNAWLTNSLITILASAFILVLTQSIRK